VWGPLLIGEFFLLRHGEFLKVDEKWEKYALLFGTLSSTTPRRNRAGRNMKPWWHRIARREENQYAVDVGLDATSYTQSIRIGGSTALLNGGANPLVIKLLGRGMSDCYQSYPVLTSKVLWECLG